MKISSIKLLLPCFIAMMFFTVHSWGSADKQVKIGVSFSIPPWVMSENDSGIELDILKASLESQGYQIDIFYAPFGQVHKLFDSGRLDGFINAKPNPKRKGFLSEPVVTFQNVAISLAEKAFPKDIDIRYLHNKQVVAFQTASSLLGDEFKHMANLNHQYQEIPKQALQINLLFIRKVDFIVLEQSIFGYYWNKAIEERESYLKGKDSYLQDIQIHHIFPKSDYAFRFKSEVVRDDFNRGLSELKRNGEYEAIIKRYDKLRNLHEKFQTN